MKCMPEVFICSQISFMYGHCYFFRIKKGISHEDIVIPIELPVTTNKDLPYLTKVTPL